MNFIFGRRGLWCLTERKTNQSDIKGRPLWWTHSNIGTTAFAADNSQAVRRRSDSHYRCSRAPEQWNYLRFHASFNSYFLERHKDSTHQAGQVRNKERNTEEPLTRASTHPPQIARTSEPTLDFPRFQHEDNEMMLPSNPISTSNARHLTPGCVHELLRSRRRKQFPGHLSSNWRRHGIPTFRPLSRFARRFDILTLHVFYLPLPLRHLFLHH